MPALAFAPPPTEHDDTCLCKQCGGSGGYLVWDTFYLIDVVVPCEVCHGEGEVCGLCLYWDCRCDPDDGIDGVNLTFDDVCPRRE